MHMQSAEGMERNEVETAREEGQIEWRKEKKYRNNRASQEKD
jgi:hypothetical protein